MTLLQVRLIGPKGLDPTTLNPDSVMLLALKGFALALEILGAIVVIYIAVGGIHYITAAGNPSEQSNAKKTVTYAIVGLALVLLAFALTNGALRGLNFVGSV